MNKSDFYEKLSKIQLELKAPKNQENKFGNYNYRNCEDILEAVKPLLNGLILTISDEVVMVGDRIYIKSTTTLTNGENSINNSAFARESLTRKGMDDAQLTGATSSYARKYALNGLFLIDDVKDVDSMDNPQQENKSNNPTVNNDKPWYKESDYNADLEAMTNAIKNGTPYMDIINQISNTFKVSNKYRDLIKSI